MEQVRNTFLDRFARVWQWFKGWWIGEVPAELAPCEFDCRKAECHEGDWNTCERRLAHANADSALGAHHQGIPHNL